jgi:hypothetical protein
MMMGMRELDGPGLVRVWLMRVPDRLVRDLSGELWSEASAANEGAASVHTINRIGNHHQLLC